MLLDIDIFTVLIYFCKNRFKKIASVSQKKKNSATVHPIGIDCKGSFLKKNQNFVLPFMHISLNSHGG